MGSITAVIYFEFEASQRFPDVGWNDFVVVILSWWIDALDQLSHGELTTHFRFMDGPFLVNASIQGEIVRLRCIEDRAGVGDRFETSVNLEEIRREVLSVAGRVSKACNQANINSADLAELRKHLPN